MKNLPSKIAITSGDPDGVGLEVSLKALLNLKSKLKTTQVFLFRSKQKCPSSIHRLLLQIPRTEVNDPQEALGLINHPKHKIVDILSSDAPASWVEFSAKNCLDKNFDGLVTAPLSKTLIQSSGLKDMGHTDILQRVCKTQGAKMGFIGRHFSVVLGTGHIPLSQVSRIWAQTSFRSGIAACEELVSLLPGSSSRSPIGVLGLNPHAGESGLIGTDEIDWMNSEIQRAKKRGHLIVGPLVPDAAFHKSNWKKYSVYLASYHDQGLIPFKMAHGYSSGVHLTLGLPLKRTSPDHGVAKDLFGKNRVDPGSMTDALRFMISWTSQKLSSKE